MSNNYYDILWISKSSTQDEIKKAYRKQAMKYHPDRNKSDKDAEKKFKEINEAYSVLSDEKKKKQYDTFGSTSWNPFSWWTWWYGWFEDIFSWFWWASNRSWNQWFEFNFEDLFWWMWWTKQNRSYTKKEEPKKPETLDFEKSYEVPIFDLILWCKIEIRWVYWNTVKLKIPAKTKHWTKFRVKWLWKKEWLKTWDLIVKIEELMPKHISDVDLHMLERIRENVGY